MDPTKISSQTKKPLFHLTTEPNITDVCGLAPPPPGKPADQSAGVDAASSPVSGDLPFPGRYISAPAVLHFLLIIASTAEIGFSNVQLFYLYSHSLIYIGQRLFVSSHLCVPWSYPW